MAGHSSLVGNAVAFTVLDIFIEAIYDFNEDVQHCESHGVTDKGTVTGHQYLVLRNR